MIGSRRNAIFSIAGSSIFAILYGVGLAALAEETSGLAPEAREFTISVDGAPRGKCTMQIRRLDDGAEMVSIDAGLKFDYVVYTYRYTSTGSEVWKEGKLVELENNANYNGKEYRVKGTAAARGLRVVVNGKTAHATHDVWATSYWRLPMSIERALLEKGAGVVQASGTRQPKDGPLAIALLDSDKGEPRRGQIQRIGEEKLKLGGKLHNCTRYRIGGDVEVDLWYDSSRRLVRQESVDSGHKTVLELARVTRK